MEARPRRRRLRRSVVIVAFYLVGGVLVTVAMYVALQRLRFGYIDSTGQLVGYPEWMNPYVHSKGWEDPRSGWLKDTNVYYRSSFQWWSTERFLFHMGVHVRGGLVDDRARYHPPADSEFSRDEFEKMIAGSGWSVEDLDRYGRLWRYDFGVPFPAFSEKLNEPIVDPARPRALAEFEYVGGLRWLPPAVQGLPWWLRMPTDILWPGFIANSIFWGLVLMVPGWLWRVVRAARRAAGVGATRCRGCRYELGSLLASGLPARSDAGATGELTSVACPECGELFDPKPRGLERACLVVGRAASWCWAARSGRTRSVRSQ
jgi:hypothetical protein